MRSITWLVPVAAVVSACGCGQHDVPGRYALDSELMARSVAAALGYGPAGTEVERVPEDQAQYTVQLVRNTAVLLTVEPDGTFETKEVIRKQGETVERHKRGTWERVGEKLEFSTDEIDGKPASYSQLTDYDGERIVFWETINGVEVNAVFVRQQ